MGVLFYPLVCLPRPYNSSFHLSKPCQLTPTHFHFIHPCQNPKSDFSLMCDTCNSSKRGSFDFPSINRTPPSLIWYHILSYCYATWFSPHLSLSWFIVLPFHFALESVGATCCYNTLLLSNRKDLEDFEETKSILVASCYYWGDLVLFLSLILASSFMDLE